MKIKADTIIRTIILGISLLNQALIISGKNPFPFAEDELYGLLSTLVTAAAAVWAWWKNNSFTQPALKADRQMKEEKAAAKVKAD